MYHHFHKHRYVLEQSGEWSFVPPSVKRRWRVADKKTDKVEKLRKYMAMRRDRFLRIRYDMSPEYTRCLQGQVGMFGNSVVLEAVVLWSALHPPPS